MRGSLSSVVFGRVFALSLVFGACGPPMTLILACVLHHEASAPDVGRKMVGSMRLGYEGR